MKNFVLGFLATMVLPAIGMFGYLRLGAAEVRADVEAPAWLSNLMSIAVHASVRRSASEVRNPLGHTNAELIAGGRLFLDGCAGCHRSPGLPHRVHTYFLPPPEFAYVGTQYSEPELFWIVKHGIRRTGMAASERCGTSQGCYSDQQIWLLAAFVNHMTNLPASVLEAIQPKRH